MPIDVEKVLEFTPHEKVADITNIQPDLKTGKYLGHVLVYPGVSNKHGASTPYLRLKWTADEAMSDGNDEEVGKSASDIFMLYPENHHNFKSLTQLKAKQFADNYPDLPPFDLSSLVEGNLESLVPWVDALESSPREFYATVGKNKETGEPQTNIYYREPGKKVEKMAPAEEEEQEEARPAAGKKGKRR